MLFVTRGKYMYVTSVPQCVINLTARHLNNKYYGSGTVVHAASQ